MVRTLASRPRPTAVCRRSLLQGAQAFFSGRYQDAVTQLEASPAAIRSAASGVRLQAQLLRAAALFSAWALDREQDDQRRQAAVRRWPNAGGSRRSSSRMRRFSRRGSSGFTRA